MPKEMLILETDRFTTLHAAATELGALLVTHPDAKITAIIKKGSAEQFSNEVEGWRSMGRVRVVVTE
jgi:hypothetical protein